MLECGYCGGQVALADTDNGQRYVHTTDGDRVTATPGDYVSAPHNRAGTIVRITDVVEAGSDMPSPPADPYTYDPHRRLFDWPTA